MAKLNDCLKKKEENVSSVGKITRWLESTCEKPLLLSKLAKKIDNGNVVFRVRKNGRKRGRRRCRKRRGS